MDIETLQLLSLIAYIAAGILFLLAVALFFLLDVPKLYGDISGRTAKKAIEAIRQQNEATGTKAYKPSTVNAERGALTDKITQSGKIESKISGASVGVGTEKFATSKLTPQSNETTVLFNSANETTLLTSEVPASGETTVLVQEGDSQAMSIPDNRIFTLDVEMSFTGSSEIIE